MLYLYAIDVVRALRLAKRTSGIPMESDVQSLRVVPMRCGGLWVRWQSVSRVGVLFSLGGVSLLVSGSPDRDGQYFSPREV